MSELPSSFVCVCVCVRERERERETDRQTDRQTETDRQTDRQRHTQTQRDTDREAQTQTETQEDRDRDRDTQAEKHARATIALFTVLLSIDVGAEGCAVSNRKAPCTIPCGSTTRNTWRRSGNAVFVFLNTLFFIKWDGPCAERLTQVSGVFHLQSRHRRKEPINLR